METAVITIERNTRSREVFENHGYKPSDEQDWTLFYDVYTCDVNSVIESLFANGIHFTIRFGSNWN